MSIENGPLNRRGLHHVLRHVGWTEIGAPSFSLKLSLDINALLEKDAF